MPSGPRHLGVRAGRFRAEVTELRTQRRRLVRDNPSPPPFQIPVPRSCTAFTNANTLATEEERLGLVHGDSRTGASAAALPAYEEDEDDEDYRASPSDDYDFDDDKANRYGRGITGSPPRGRAASGSSSGSDEKAMGRREEATTPPPRPPTHGTRYGTPGGGSGGAGGRGTPGTGTGTPHAFI